MNKKEKLFLKEYFLRLKARAEQNKQQAELDLKILEKWKKDFWDLLK
jgi:hypothetical protein